MVYCGNCGGDLLALFEQRRQKVMATLAQSETLRIEGRYAEAAALLKELRGNGDTRLESLIGEAHEKASGLFHERDAKVQEAIALHAEANELVTRREFSAANRTLEQIPPGLRSREVAVLLEQCRSTLAEIQVLTERIREASRNKAWDNLLPSVTRLRELRPHDEKLRRMAEQLEDRQRQQTSLTTEQTLARAKRHYLQGQYAAAAELLDALDETHILPQHRPLYDTIREVAWLAHDSKRAPFQQDYLLSTAQRWLKYRAEDKDAQRISTELKKRMPLKNPDPRLAKRWAKAPETTAFQIPIELWQGTKQALWDPESESAREVSSARFLAAYGLALQGLRQSNLTLDLMPTTSKSRLPKLSLLSKPAKPNAVWGLDLGATGIKALQLLQDDADGPLRVAQIHYLPYEKPLADVAGDDQQRDLYQAALQAFVEQAEVDQASVVIGFAGTRSLSRNFEIPQFKGKKAVEAIAYEARLQIPIPLEQIYYAWHAWPSSSAEGATSFQSVSLLAARRDHVQQPVDLCAELPLKVLAVTSVCAGLYNAAVHEFYPAIPGESEAKRSQGHSAGTAEEAGERSGQGLVVLELGADSSNLVLVSPTQMRFRSIQVGSHRLDRSLMSGFTLTRGQSQHIREQPARARWLYQIDRHVAAVYGELAHEVRRTIQAWSSEGVELQRMLVTGGGTEQLGLMRFLVHGA
jgi:Tfp pilus assembly PilM family ATPase